MLAVSKMRKHPDTARHGIFHRMFHSMFHGIFQKHAMAGCHLISVQHSSLLPFTLAYHTSPYLPSVEMSISLFSAPQVRWSAKDGKRTTGDEELRRWKVLNLLRTAGGEDLTLSTINYPGISAYQLYFAGGYRDGRGMLHTCIPRYLYVGYEFISSTVWATVTSVGLCL